MPLDDIALYKYTPVEITFKNDTSIPKVTDSVQLKMSAKRELYRVEANQQMKPIAADVRKTGYYKIAQLVEMSEDADTTMQEKVAKSVRRSMGLEENKKSESDHEEEENHLNQTVNP